MSKLATKEKAGKVAGFSLIPVAPLFELARVYQFGAEHRAGPNDWRLGLPWSECFDAVERHILKLRNRETFDGESTLHHAAHAAFWLFALMEYTITHPELDDRAVLQALPTKSLQEWVIEAGKVNEGQA